MSRIAKATAVVLGAGAMALGGAGLAMADAGAQAEAVGSAGVGSGNVASVPAHLPVNATGNSANVIGVLNPAFGSASSNS